MRVLGRFVVNIELYIRVPSNSLQTQKITPMGQLFWFYDHRFCLNQTQNMMVYRECESEGFLVWGGGESLSAGDCIHVLQRFIQLNFEDFRRLNKLFVITDRRYL